MTEFVNPFEETEEVARAKLLAETAKQQGLEAALTVAQSHAGRFDFAPGSPTPERSFQASVTEVILEATRRLDEGDDLESPHPFDEDDDLESPRPFDANDDSA